MSKSLDGKTIRIKGTELTTKVRYCTTTRGFPQVITVACCMYPGHDEYPGFEALVSEDNPYADAFRLDEIELPHPEGGWYTPKFTVNDR